MKPIVWMAKTAQDMAHIGRALAGQARAGDAILLRGDLGAGKSVLARGVARGLLIEGPIPSPTFTILNIHRGRLPLYHFDLYRLEEPDELYALGLDEYLDGDGVAVVEWPDMADLPPLKGYAVEIEIEDDGGRRVSVLPMGGAQMPETWRTTDGGLP